MQQVDEDEDEEDELDLEDENGRSKKKFNIGNIFSRNKAEKKREEVKSRNAAKEFLERRAAEREMRTFESERRFNKDFGGSNSEADGENSRDRAPTRSGSSSNIFSKKKSREEDDDVIRF